MTVPSCCRTGSSNVAPRIRSRRSGMNAVNVMLLMATSSVTGSYVGAWDKACVVTAWELSLVASPGSQLAVYGQSPQ